MLEPILERYLKLFDGVETMNNKINDDDYITDMDRSFVFSEKPTNIKTGEELLNYLEEERKKYDDTSLCNIFYQYLSGKSENAIMGKFRIKGVKQKLNFLSQNINFEYFDNNYVPLLYNILFNENLIQAALDIDDIVLRYLKLRNTYIRPKELIKSPSGFALEKATLYMEKVRIEQENIKKAEEAEMKKLEEQKVTECFRSKYYNFFVDLKKLLAANETQEIQIKGLEFNYVISEYDNILSLKKSNSDVHCKVEYSLSSCAVINYYDDFSEKNGETNEGLELIDYFYSLFMHRLFSRYLLELLSKITNKFNDMDYECRDLETNCHYSIKKVAADIIVIIKYDSNDNVLLKYAYKKIEGIPNWFVISSMKQCRDNNKRLIFLFSKDNYVTQQRLNQYENFTEEKIIYDPYWNFEDRTEAEQLVVEVKNNLRNAYVEGFSEDMYICPKCGNKLILKCRLRESPRKFLGCSSFPSCKGARDIPQK